MKRQVAVGFLLLMSFDTLAQICFKLAGEHALPLEANIAWLIRVFGHAWIYGAVLGYIGAFVCWMSLLRRAPIGPAFAASHLEVISVMLLSHGLFGEALTVVRMSGALAIVAGIVCLALAESKEQSNDLSALTSADATRAGLDR